MSKHVHITLNLPEIVAPCPSNFKLMQMRLQPATAHWLHFIEKRRLEVLVSYPPNVSYCKPAKIGACIRDSICGLERKLFCDKAETKAVRNPDKCCMDMVARAQSETSPATEDSPLLVYGHTDGLVPWDLHQIRQSPRGRSNNSRAGHRTKELKVADDLWTFSESGQAAEVSERSLVTKYVELCIDARLCCDVEKCNVLVDTIMAAHGAKEFLVHRILAARKERAAGIEPAVIQPEVPAAMAPAAMAPAAMAPAAMAPAAMAPAVLPEIQPFPEDIPEIQPSPEDLSEIQQFPEDIPEIQPFPEDLPEIQPSPEDLPEIQPFPEDIPEIQPFPEDLPEIQPSPEDLPEIQPFPEDIPEIQPFPEDLPEIQPSPEDLPEIQPFPAHLPEIQLFPEDIPDILDIMGNLLTLPQVAFKPQPEPYIMRDPHLNDDLHEYVRSLRKTGKTGKTGCAKKDVDSSDDDWEDDCDKPPAVSCAAMRLPTSQQQLLRKIFADR